MNVCDTCKGTGVIPVGTSGQEIDGNAIEYEQCPECGYAAPDTPAKASDTPSIECEICDYPAKPCYGQRQPHEDQSSCKLIIDLQRELAAAKVRIIHLEDEERLSITIIAEDKVELAAMKKEHDTAMHALHRGDHSGRHQGNRFVSSESSPITLA